MAPLSDHPDAQTDQAKDILVNPTYHQFLVSREFGGAAEIALRLAGHWHACENQNVAVWIPGQGRAWQKATEQGLPIQAYDAQRLFSHGRWTAGCANIRLGLKLRRHRPGIAHVHDPFYYAAMRHALKVSRLKTVVHVHIEYDPEGLRYAFRQPPDLIITCAAFLEDQVRRTLPAKYRDRQPIAVVPNAVDIERFFPADKLAAKRALGASPEQSLVLMLANLAPHKGQETAIRACAELRSRNIRASLWLAGVEREAGGSYRSHLEELIASLGVKQDVHLLGFRNDASALLQAADMLLLPSTKEGLPLTILEAQASKVPVIAAPTAGVPEVITDGVTGFLVAADDAHGYANRIEQLIRDSEAHRPLIEAAYLQATQAYNWQRYRDQIRTLYRELLTPSPPSLKTL
jgi:glycosyltransferase involved in cell wall biosynthesis